MVTLSKKKQLLGVPPPLSSIVAKCVKKLGFVTFGRVEICSLKFSRTLGVWWPRVMKEFSTKTLIILGNISLIFTNWYIWNVSTIYNFDSILFLTLLPSTMDVLMVPSFLSPTGGEAATSPQTAIRNIFDDTLGKDPKTFLRNPSVYGISPVSLMMTMMIISNFFWSVLWIPSKME